MLPFTHFGMLGILWYSINIFVTLTGGRKVGFERTDLWIMVETSQFR